MTLDQALSLCKDLICTLSTPRRCRSCTVLTIAIPPTASVVFLALVLARLPASTRCRRARQAAQGGSLVGGHGVVFSGGSPWTVTGPLFDLPDLLVFLLFIRWAHAQFACVPQASPHEHQGDGHAYSRPATLARCIDMLSNYGSEEGALYGQGFFPTSRGPFRVRFSTPFTGGHYP
jgi:hypothetical protein